MKVIIRPAVESDADSIAMLADMIWHACYAEILQAEQIDYMLKTLYDPTPLKSFISSGSQPFFLAILDQEPIGFASCSLADPQIAKLNKLYVLPGMQGNGTGALLLDQVISTAREWGCGRIVLNVNRYNPALHFYKHHGFEILYEEDIPIGPYWMNDYVMGKNIA